MRIGIDLGGTKIEGLALDTQGRELARLRVATPAGDYGAILDAIAAMVAALERATGQKGSVGIGTPGTLSPATGAIKNANSTCLIGRPLDRDLASRLGRPVRLANDANCFALSEAVDGAGRGADVLFGVILGTGVGGGIIAGGRALVGVNGIAGEWGHNPLPSQRDEERPGPLCYCGRYGCIETFLSGPALARDHEAATGERIVPDEIETRARRGDTRAEATLARYEERLARALASVINILDPDAIVLGGGLSRIERLYVNVPRLWIPYVFSDRIATRLVPPQHGDASGVRGAAWLWPADEASGGRPGRVP
jgi:fructokinase